MRPATLIAAICALAGASVTARDLAHSSSFDLSAAASSASALYSSMETANPTALLSEINSQGTAAIASLKSMAATATGAYGSTLRQEASQLAQQLSSAQKSVSAALGKTTGSGSSSAGATGSSNAAATGSSSGFAPATAVPIAAVGVGLAVLGML